MKINQIVKGASNAKPYKVAPKFSAFLYRNFNISQCTQLKGHEWYYCDIIFIFILQAQAAIKLVRIICIVYRIILNL